MLRHLCALAAIGLLTATASASIIDMQQTPLEADALHIEDETWDLGEDWGYDDSSYWMNEDWIGGPGSVVEFEHLIDVDDTRSGGFPITGNKNVNNSSTFFWTDYHIDLIPREGALAIINVTASPNAAFGNVMTIDNGNGSWSINWDNFGGNGTGVPIGGNTTFSFHFEILGDVAFKIRQTPTPEPASLAMLALGAALVRRRRGAQL